MYAVISFISYYPISCGLVVAIKTLKNLYNKQTENKLLQTENANAGLQLLKAQVHPHFLFNTLNNIYSFTLDNNLQAPALVKNLSDTLRYMLTECEERLVLLPKELKMITDYIELEKTRYGKRLNLSVMFEGDAGNKIIVPLLMIPFVENSFKNGASAMRGDVWISLHPVVAGTMHYFTMSNSRPVTVINPARGGIGLNNVRKRLSLLYPGRHLLQTKISEDVFKQNIP